MNPIQKQWLALGAAVMLAMLIYPPWVKITHYIVGSAQSPLQTDTQESAGYSWLSAPPKANTPDTFTSIKIDYARLVTQWAVAAFVIGAGLLFFKGSDKNSLAEWWSAVGGSAKPAPPSNPPKPRPPPAPPVSRSLVPPAIGRSETKQRTPPNESSPWRRAQKKAGTAFGIGSFVGIASAYQGSVATGFPFAGRMLFTLFAALFLGLLCAAVTFVVAGLYFAAKGGPEVAGGRSSLTASTKSRPTSAPPKPTAPDSPSSKAQVSLAATLNQAEEVLQQAAPISEKPLPTDVGSRSPPGASPTPRAAQWLYFDQQACRRGPVSEAELEKLFFSGEIRAGASVWSEGLPQWVPFLQRHCPVETAPQPLKSRPLRIVQVNDETLVNEAFDVFIRGRFPDATVLSFDNAVAALKELSQTDPDLLITDDEMPGMNGKELCQRLLDKKVTYPIIVNSAWEPTEHWVREFSNQGLNVSFLPVPCDAVSLRNLVEAAFKIRCEGIEKPVEIAPQSLRTRPLRIIMVDDVDAVLEANKIGMQILLPEATILAFQWAGDGLKEVERQHPDLFTTDWTHAGMAGPEILQRLAAMKVRCPIFVISAVAKLCGAEKLLEEYSAQGLNVTLLEKPFMVAELRSLLLKHLGPGCNPQRQSLMEVR